MKIGFIEWFVSLFLRDMRDYKINGKEKNRLYTQIRKTQNTKSKKV